MLYRRGHTERAEVSRTPAAQHGARRPALLYLSNSEASQPPRLLQGSGFHGAITGNPCLHEKKMGCWQGDGAMHARLPVSPTSQTENVRRWRCETQDGGRGDTWRPAHDFSWPGCPMAAPIPTETRDSGNGDHPERHRTTHPKRRGRDDRPVLSAERAGVQRRRAW